MFKGFTHRKIDKVTNNIPNRSCKYHFETNLRLTIHELMLYLIQAKIIKITITIILDLGTVHTLSDSPGYDNKLRRLSLLPTSNNLSYLKFSFNFVI